jgi:hypothetical protein
MHSGAQWLRTVATQYPRNGGLTLHHQLARTAQHEECTHGLLIRRDHRGQRPVAGQSRRLVGPRHERRGGSARVGPTSASRAVSTLGPCAPGARLNCEALRFMQVTRIARMMLSLGSRIPRGQPSSGARRTTSGRWSCSSRWVAGGGSDRHGNSDSQARATPRSSPTTLSCTRVGRCSPGMS